MSCVSVVVFSFLICGSWSTEQLKFPPSFMFGASSAAYQVEGGWNASDKGVSIWDKLLHGRPELVVDGSNGDVACDSYHLWRRDIEMCEELGLNMYRFSISWPRLLPSGFANYVSEDGKNYYNNLIDGLLEKGIEPLVTIYHFDLPQSLQDLGGWANPLVADWFADYAEIVFSLYADRVKYWLTLNEPMGVCDGGYETFAAPYFDDPDVGRYLCNKNLLIAHAKAYRIYEDFYKEKYHGKLSLATLFFWFKPFEPADVEVTDLTIDHWEGRFTHAIFSKEGGWPPKLEKILNDIARKEGYKHPRLPPFTPEEIELVRGSYDYYALNHYTTQMVRRVKPGEQPGKWFLKGAYELGTITFQDPSWETTVNDWFAVYPEGIREQLHWLNSTYDVKEIVITENGVPSLDPGLVDTQRLEYYRDYLEQVLLAIHDGINVTGYSAWTLMDNFEWMGGYAILIGGSWSMEQLKFPPSFMFGAASAAFQVEGAWNVSDKSPGLWDKLTHDRPELVADSSNGDVACDSYHQWRRDIEMCEELGLKMYRFSISWSRLLPTGFPNHISEDGKNYYNNLIDGLLEKGIQPIVTIFHFDFPQSLQDLGGWANPLIADWFADYAEVVFFLYADRVKYWLTINEPMMLCDGGYEQFGAPYIDDPDVGRYLCNKNTLIAHAKAYRLYHELYGDKYHGKLSLATLFFWFKPFTPEDQEVTDLTREHWEGRYAHAIFSKEGVWSRKLEKLLNDIARKEGFARPRLPPFTPEEKELVRGTYDYYALNHYTTRLVRRVKPEEHPGKWIFDGSPELNTIMDKDPSWGTTAIDWFAVYPPGLQEQLHWLNSTYDVKEIVITENGVPSIDPGLVDMQRLEYYRDYLEQVLLAINDGINVTGYTAWTLMDNFEWLSGYVASVSHSCGHDLKFPSWFKFGAASAAYQVEGAWNVSDKGESKWDRRTHRYPELSSDGSNGDDACNSYYLWQRDIEMAAELGLQFYRFSISWPRLLPTGLANKVSDDGKNYYNKLIDGLLEKGIEPIVTIYHWDMPQMLQDLGGWANPQISDWFADYARIVYSLYGDRVKTWITINEPLLDCDWYYGWGVLTPGLDYYVGPYICTKNLLLAHAKAYHVYDQEFRHKYNGKVSLTNHFLWLQPYSDSPEDKKLTETARQFITGRYTHPIFSKEGGWPPVVEETVARVSKEQGFKESRLPAFTQEEKDLIRGTYDYLGLNHYTTKLVRKPEPSEEITRSILTYIGDLDVVLVDDPSWTFGYSQLIGVNPQGIREQMAWLKDQYGDIEILITENGYSTAGSNLTDDSRISFINDHLEQVLLSIKDGVNVTGYAYWAIMDDFEWTDEYQSKFGLYEVDFSVPMRTRTARKSAVYYSNVISKRSLDVS